MKKRQLATLGLTLGLVGAVGVGGTMALLSAQSNRVENTFKVGKGLHDSDITLDEAQVDEKGKEIVGAARVQKNDYKNLEQGAELDKDPTVSIKNTAADCYVFVTIDGLDAQYYDVTIDENWIETTREGVYAYNTDEDKTKGDVVSGGLAGDAGLVFDGVKIKDAAPLFEQKGEEWVEKTLPPIVVKACAVQANNVTYEQALAAATFAQ